MNESGAIGSALSLVGERTVQSLLQRLTEVAVGLTGSWGAIAILLWAPTGRRRSSASTD